MFHLLKILNSHLLTNLHVLFMFFSAPLLIECFCRQSRISDYVLFPTIILFKLFTKTKGLKPVIHTRENYVKQVFLNI